MRTFKTVALLAFSLAAMSTVLAQTQDGLGVGIMFGEPTGFSIKKWIGHDRAIDAGIAWSLSEHDSLHLQGDYLVHKFYVSTSRDLPGRFALYLGLGGRIKVTEEDNWRGDDEDVRLGIRAPLGISYLFVDAPFDLFAEIVPILDVLPDTDFDLNGAIGARFYF